MSKQLVALMRFNYAGKTLEVGDQFDAQAEHADLFVKLGRARIGKADKPEEPEEVKAVPVKAVSYGRKDMKAK